MARPCFHRSATRCRRRSCLGVRARAGRSGYLSVSTKKTESITIRLYWHALVESRHVLFLNFLKYSSELRAKAFEANGDTRGAARMRESFARGGWKGFNRNMVGDQRPPNVPSYFLAVSFTALGEKDKAFEALNKSYEDHEISLVQLLNNDQRLDPLRDDPRFQGLMKRIGFAN